MKKLIFILTAIIFCSCAKPGTDVNTSNNKDNFQVQMLFSIGNDTIYRFYDDGRYHYFKNGNGGVSYQINSGKTTREETIY